MDPLVKKLAKCGIHGRLLSEIPDDVLEAVAESGVGEIVSADKAINLIYDKIVGADLGEDYKAGKSKGEVCALQPRTSYVLRLKTDEWAKYVLHNFAGKMDVYYHIISELVLARDGLSKEQLLSRIEYTGDCTRRLRQLMTANLIVKEENENGTAIYKYNWDRTSTPKSKKVQQEEEDGQPAGLDGKVEHAGVDVNILLERAEKEKVFVLSNLRRELRKSARVEYSQSDEELASMLEDRDFQVIEMGSKYMPNEYVLYHAGISSDDKRVSDAVEKAKGNVFSGFRFKLWRQFCQVKDSRFESNGYDVTLSGRVRRFYQFISERLAEDAGQLFFNVQMVLGMNFLDFAACVPLGTPNLLLFTAVCFAEREKQSELFSARDFLEFVSEASPDPSAIYDRAKSVLAPAKLLDVISLLSTVSDEQLLRQLPVRREAIVTELSKKAVPGSFGEILRIIADHQIFNVYEENGFAFFSSSKSAESNMRETMLMLNCIDTNEMSLEERMTLFKQLSVLSQEEFADESKEIFSALNPNLRRKYHRKLKEFK